MSLQVWLPLNGDLCNQGLSNVTVINNGAIINNNGKIGKCYYFNGNATRLKIANPITDSINQFSLCCWFYMDSSVNKGTFFGARSAGSGKGILCFMSKAENFFLFDDGTRFQLSYNITNLIGSWHHIAFVKTPTQKKIFLDGQLIGSQDKQTTTANIRNELTIGNDTYEVYTGNALKGYMNDIRIYDHCLSDKEVKEISKGLILHYKLDNIVNSNLLKSIPRSVTPATFCGYQLNLTEKLELDQTYTLQLWDINLSHTGKTSSQLKLGIYLGGGSNYLTGIAIPTGHLDYKKITFKKTSWSNTSDATHLYLNIYNSPSSASGTKDMSIGNWKLEKGSVATPWCAFDSDTTIVYDSSGYENNGTITGSLSAVADSARYNCATFISNGATNYIQSPTLQLPGDQITINYWFKSSNISPGSNYHIPINSYTTQAYEMSIYKTGYLRGGLKVNGTRYVADCTSTKLLDGNWHMCSMTYDGTIIKRYVDGVMEKSTSITGTLDTSESFIFGHYGSNTSYYCVDANISDARIYATALSEADILELYNTSASIDSSGNAYARELVEI